MASPQPQPRSFVAHREGIANVLATKVSIGEAFNPLPNTPPPPLKEYTAIWDTGATNTVITRKVAEECDLKPIGMARIHTAGGDTDSCVYFVSIYLPNDVGITQVRVTEGSISGDAEALVSRLGNIFTQRHSCESRNPDDLGNGFRVKARNDIGCSFVKLLQLRDTRFRDA